MTPWLRVRYNHKTDDLNPIYMAVSKEQPSSDSDLWTAAYRDTIDNIRVVQIRATIDKGEHVWLMDSNGIRRVNPL